MTAMHDLILFMFPGACSRVTMSALEEVGLDYEERMVNLRSGEQKSSAYLSLNPKGKVPALRMGERIITENSAIIWSLHLEHPNANLLPRDHDPVAYDQGLIDLIWCSGTMHPIVRQIRNPMRLTKGDTSGVRADGLEKFAHECEALGDRLSDGRWWYGSTCSIIDVYLCWLCSAAHKGGFPLSDYPEIMDHSARVRVRPSVQRALQREEAVVARHKADLPHDFAL